MDNVGAVTVVALETIEIVILLGDSVYEFRLVPLRYAETSKEETVIVESAQKDKYR
jgi:hypothetical protein